MHCTWNREVTDVRVLCFLEKKIKNDSHCDNISDGISDNLIYTNFNSFAGFLGPVWSGKFLWKRYFSNNELNFQDKFNSNACKFST